MASPSVPAGQPLNLFVNFGSDHVNGSQIDAAREALEEEYHHRDEEFRDRLVHEIRAIGGTLHRISLINNTIRQTKDIRTLSRPGLLALYKVLLQWQSAYTEVADQLESLHNTYSPVAPKDSVFLANLAYKVDQYRTFRADAERQVEKHEKRLGGEKTMEVGYALYFINPLKRRYDQAMAEIDLGVENELLPTRNVFAKFDDDWHAIGTAKGGMGNIVKVVQVDEHGKIINRVVQKDTRVISTVRWSDPTCWHGDINKRIPMEWYAHSLASRNGATRRNRFVLFMHSDRPQVSRLMRRHRFLLEYAPYGDLIDIQWGYMQRGERVPESFIVYLFKALIEGCLVMEQGDVSSQVPGWQEIVHRDLKPENIFMGSHRRSCFPQYPEPKLADFGLAFLTNPQDAFNPCIYLSRGTSGTRGYIPPEQIRFVNDITRKPFDASKMLSPCNVWGIGVILLGLMELELPDAESQPTYVDDDMAYELSDECRGIYTQDLCDAVAACVQYDLEARPKLADLLSWINEKISSDEHLQRANAGQQAAMVKLLKSHDVYKLGMVLRRAS